LAVKLHKKANLGDQGRAGIPNDINVREIGCNYMNQSDFDQNRAFTATRTGFAKSLNTIESDDFSL
jgi:hypothetical protein